MLPQLLSELAVAAAASLVFVGHQVLSRGKGGSNYCHCYTRFYIIQYFSSGKDKLVWGIVLNLRERRSTLDGHTLHRYHMSMNTSTHTQTVDL